MYRGRLCSAEDWVSMALETHNYLDMGPFAELMVLYELGAADPKNKPKELYKSYIERSESNDPKSSDHNCSRYGEI